MSVAGFPRGSCSHWGLFPAVEKTTVSNHIYTLWKQSLAWRDDSAISKYSSCRRPIFTYQTHIRQFTTACYSSSRIHCHLTSLSIFMNRTCAHHLYAHRCTHKQKKSLNKTENQSLPITKLWQEAARLQDKTQKTLLSERALYRLARWRKR